MVLNHNVWFVHGKYADIAMQGKSNRVFILLLSRAAFLFFSNIDSDPTLRSIQAQYRTNCNPVLKCHIALLYWSVIAFNEFNSRARRALYNSALSSRTRRGLVNEFSQLSHARFLGRMLGTLHQIRPSRLGTPLGNGWRVKATLGDHHSVCKTGNYYYYYQWDNYFSSSK